MVITRWRAWVPHPVCCGTTHGLCHRNGVLGCRVTVPRADSVAGMACVRSAGMACLGAASGLLRFHALTAHLCHRNGVRRRRIRAEVAYTGAQTTRPVLFPCIRRPFLQ